MCALAASSEVATASIETELRGDRGVSATGILAKPDLDRRLSREPCSPPPSMTNLPVGE